MPHVTPLTPPLRARNGCCLRIIIVARISTDHQDPRSLADQEALCRAYIAQHYGGEVEFVVIASQGSGEHLDRKELRELEDRITSQTFDVLIVEDLGRICRRQRALDFCEMCQDCGTRLIAINDRVDTAVDGWQDAAFIAVWHHERSNRDTADRIRRSLNNRFDNGGVVQFILYGYIKPPGAKSDLQLQKDPAAEPVIRELFRRLEQGRSTPSWPTGSMSKASRPAPAVVSNAGTGPWSVSSFTIRFLRASGCGTGASANGTTRLAGISSMKAEPHQLRVRKCPHLAYFEPAYYDRVIQVVDARNGGCGRTSNGYPDPRLGFPRKRTRFPGQHARCGICGRLMHWNGMKGSQVLLCSGASDYRCWNGLFINSQECSRRILAAVQEAVTDLPDFDEVFGGLIREQAADLEGRQSAELTTVDQQLQTFEHRLANLLTMIERRPDSESLLQRLDELERERSELRHRRQQLADQPTLTIAFPDADRLRDQAAESLRDLMTDDQEACRLLRQLIPDLRIVPYQVCDGSDIVPRAEFTLTLAPLLPPILANLPAAALVTRSMVVTLEVEGRRVVDRDLTRGSVDRETIVRVAGGNGGMHLPKQAAVDGFV